jgi:hypothetical protein
MSSLRHSRSLAAPGAARVEVLVYGHGQRPAVQELLLRRRELRRAARAPHPLAASGEIWFKRGGRAVTARQGNRKEGEARFLQREPYAVQEQSFLSVSARSGVLQEQSREINSEKKLNLGKVSPGEMKTADKSRNSLLRDWTTATTHDERFTFHLALLFCCQCESVYYVAYGIFYCLNFIKIS